MGNLLWVIIVVLVVIWLLGLALRFGGALIHLVIVVAVIALLFQLITGRRKL